MAHGRIGLHDLRVTPFRPLPSRLTRPLSVLVVLAWLVQMGLLIRQAYFGAPVALAADLARYGSSAQWRGIYYIFDTSDAKGYVGSAYGEYNPLGRWLGQYAKCTFRNSRSGLVVSVRRQNSSVHTAPGGGKCVVIQAAL